MLSIFQNLTSFHRIQNKKKSQLSLESYNIKSRNPLILSYRVTSDRFQVPRIFHDNISKSSTLDAILSRQVYSKRISISTKISTKKIYQIIQHFQRHLIVSNLNWKKKKSWGKTLIPNIDENFAIIEHGISPQFLIQPV